MSDDTKDVVLTNPRLDGFPYGMQRDFETEIVRITEGQLYSVPDRKFPKLIARFSHPSTRYASIGQLIPKHSISELKADTLWVVLMGPEDFPFWFYKDWESKVKRTVLYLFDTMEAQIPILRKVISRGRWDFLITSFPSAVPMLERETGRKWYSVVQGVTKERFYPLLDSEEPAIAFSSYGRRWPALHNALRIFCLNNKLHYDYTVASGLQPGTDPRDNYEIMAWHLRQSWFTVGWPVERTNPGRVKTFSPITCRWFEAAASGAVVIGEAPSDPAFDEIFGREFVVPLKSNDSENQLVERLQSIWNNRIDLRKDRLLRIRQMRNQWTWESRVKEIQTIINTQSPVEIENHFQARRLQESR